MRRVICDIVMIITTIAPPRPDDGGEADGGPMALPAWGRRESQPGAPPQLVDAAPHAWIIYQEFIFVHCQRNAPAKQNVIDCAGTQITPNFSDDSGQEA